MLVTRALARVTRSFFSLSLLAVTSWGAASCNPQDIEEILGDVRDGGAPPTGTAIPSEASTDDVGTHAADETRVLIRTAQGYEDYFGHAPPAGVDLTRQWVIFYAAGTRNTGGFEATILSLTRADKSLVAITQLVSPGGDCVVTQALTAPHVLIKFAAQPGANLQFNKSDRVQGCGAAAVRCGGFGGLQCPGTGTCIDDPTDSCDPQIGDTDCWGVCTCVQKVLCTSDATFDGSPGVCACVPRTPPAPAVHCGGIAGIACPGSGTCVDDPSDGCDPQAGGADCGGICTCVQNVLCTRNATFNNSPAVCACVPQTPPTCGPNCDIFCQYGHVLDAAGCPTCACNPAPKP